VLRDSRGDVRLAGLDFATSCVLVLVEVLHVSWVGGDARRHAEGRASIASIG
jgi:hypothetical protein